jgi:hypothetical protein
MDMKTGLRCQGCRELGSIQWWAWVLAALNLRITYQEVTATVDSAYLHWSCAHSMLIEMYCTVS